MFELELYKIIGSKEIYKIRDLLDNSYVGIEFRKKHFNALIVVDHKTKEIVLHDMYNVIIPEIIELINKKEKWNNYKICNY